MFRFGPNLLDAAQAMVHASAAAYANDPTNYVLWPLLGFEQTATFPVQEFRIDDLGSTTGFVASNAENLVIAFRGSDDYLDLAVNLTASQNADRDFYQGAVHQGFAVALDGVWIELRTLIDSLHREGQRIWITGHSLGGALATLTAKRLHAFMGPVRCITFGQPRVGDPEFLQNYTVTHHRFVNEHDMITKLPPRSVFTRYWHVGLEQFLDEAGNLLEGKGDTSLLEDLFFGRLARTFNLKDARNESFLDEVIQRGRRDHKIATYAQRIDALISARS